MISPGPGGASGGWEMFPMRRVVSMRLMVSVCALVIAVVMAAPGAYAGPDGRSPSVTGSTVGDTIRLSGFNGERLGVTLVKVTDPAYPTDDMNGAASGNRLVGVQLGSPMKARRRTPTQRTTT